MNMSLQQLIPSAGALLFQIALLRIFVKRNLKARFPVFFYFLGLEALTLVTVLVIGPHLPSKVYFYVYWGLNALLMVLTFGVLFEVFVNTLKPFSGLIDLGKLLFAWAAGFLLIASVLTAIATTGHQSEKLCAAMNLVARSVGLMQCGLLFLFLLFEKRLGLSWRNNGMTIALALGTSAALDLISSLVSERVPAWSSALSTFDAFSYMAVFGFWLVMFAIPEPARKSVQDSPMRLIFQRWNDTLLSTPFVSQNNLAMASMDSFLPNVESTVERVMARKMMQ